jgi:hypothetical protein
MDEAQGVAGEAVMSARAVPVLGPLGFAVHGSGGVARRSEEGGEGPLRQSNPHCKSACYMRIFDDNHPPRPSDRAGPPKRKRLLWPCARANLCRTNRTNQAQPLLFPPVATDMKREKRFLSTIARRLDTLGAITRGQRQTGSQGLFQPEDNLESPYRRTALRQLYQLL